MSTSNTHKLACSCIASVCVVRKMLTIIILYEQNETKTFAKLASRLQMGRYLFMRGIEWGKPPKRVPLMRAM
jgi:hypothetical protein